MHKLLVMYNRPSDAARFRAYYENHHLPMAGQLPGLQHSSYSFTINGTDAYFCIWEGTFADEAAALAAIDSDVGRQVAADTANYADGGFLLLHFTLKRGPMP